MLKFTKGFINNTSDKIATSYNKVTELQKIEDIRKRLHPDIYKKVEEKEEQKIDAEIINYQSRINAMKNINKG